MTELEFNSIEELKEYFKTIDDETMVTVKVVIGDEDDERTDRA